MNKYQEALNKIKEDYEETHCQGMGTCYDFEDIKLFQELVDRATPKKPIIVKEIGDYDEDGFSKSYEYEVTKCEGCNTVLVDLETDEIDRSGEPFCFNCGQALDWSEDE